MLNTTINEVKMQLKAGTPTAGAWLQLCSTIAADIMADAGFDWLLIDMEHSPLGMETLMTIVQAMQGRKAVPFVRPPWNDFVTIKRILDTGVYGVVVPYVNTREEAEAAVRACKYPPLGVRGVANSPRGASYGASFERIKTLNEEICVITQIETIEAVSNVPELLKVDGLDGLFIGPMDLSSSCGHLGNPDHSEVREVIEEVERLVFASDKFLGTISFNWEDACAKFDRGYKFVTIMSDIGALADAARNTVRQFNAKYGKN